ncbi:MAG: hypothetical protein ACE5OZ_16635 [Candidatus Heimdallarchaeota archaeon]
MAERNVISMVNQVNATLERLEKLIRDRYTQSIQNYFERSTKRLRQEIQTGFAAISSVQSTADLTPLVEGLAKFEKDLESSSDTTGIQQELARMRQEFSDRIEAIEKQLTEISTMIGSLASETKPPQEEPRQELSSPRQVPFAREDHLPPSTATQTSSGPTSKSELKEELSSLYAYLRWINDPPGEMKAKSAIVKEINKAIEKAEQISNEDSLSLSLRNQAHEVARLLSDASKTISVSTQGKFYVEDVREIGAALIRHLKRLIAEL